MRVTVAQEIKTIVAMIAVAVMMNQRVDRFERADCVCADLPVMPSALLISATGCAGDIATGAYVACGWAITAQTRAGWLNLSCQKHRQEMIDADYSLMPQCMMPEAWSW